MCEIAILIARGTIISVIHDAGDVKEIPFYYFWDKLSQSVTIDW